VPGGSRWHLAKRSRKMTIPNKHRWQTSKATIVVATPFVKTWRWCLRLFFLEGQLCICTKMTIWTPSQWL
jgi:hypothetical protein